LPPSHVFLVGLHWVYRNRFGMDSSSGSCLPALWYAGRQLTSESSVVAIVGGTCRVLVAWSCRSDIRRLPSSIVERGGVSASPASQQSANVWVLYLELSSVAGRVRRLVRCWDSFEKLLPHRSSSKSFSGGAVNLSLRSSTRPLRPQISLDFQWHLNLVDDGLRFVGGAIVDVDCA